MASGPAHAGQPNTNEIFQLPPKIKRPNLHIVRYTCQCEQYQLQPFFNNTHFGQTLINCIHNQHRIGIPDEYFVETCINTYTQNGFVTKEFVKIDEDSQTQDYTIIYIKFQGQTPPFSTHNRDIFERLLPTPFPQVGDILTEEEDSESEQELIA